MKIISRCLNYLKPYRTSIFLSVFLNIFYAVLSGLAISMMIPVLNILFEQEIPSDIHYQELSGSVSEWGDILKENLVYWVDVYKKEFGVRKALLIFSIVFVLLFFLRNIFRFASQYFAQFFMTGAIRDIRVETHDKLLHLPLSYFGNRRKGDIISRLSNDIGMISGSVFGPIIELLRVPINIVITLVFLFAFSQSLTLFSLIIFPLMGFLIAFIGRSLKRNSSKAQKELGLLFSFIDESVSGVSIIKIFNATKQISERFRKSNNLLRRHLVKVALRNQLASPTSELLGAITMALIVFFGGYLSSQGKGLRPEEFVPFMGLFYTLLDPLKTLAKSISELQKGQISAERVFEILDEDEVIKDESNSVKIKEFRDEILFDNISFSYGEEKVVENFTLSLPKGKTIALIGESGSGKSTLANLVTRFYNTTEGKIFLDGRDIREIQLDSYRSLFGMVTQSVTLFNTTIAENISLGIENPNLEDVKRAAKVANAHEFIMNLEEGYYTNIGDAGTKLSGGQRQRICIARAVMKNPPIMILDEATSALDTKSEKLVQVALDQLLNDRTSLIIAHRLSTIQNADLIVVMDNGEIVEQGTHSELLAKKGLYTKYIELQKFQN